MLVKEAIEQLSTLNPDDEIIFAFWTKDFFSFPIADWDELASMCDDVIDWYDITLQVHDLAQFQWDCRRYSEEMD